MFLGRCRGDGTATPQDATFSTPPLESFARATANSVVASPTSVVTASARVTVYVAESAPVIGEHSHRQRTHAQVNVNGDAPAHVPGAAVSVLPTFGVPLIEGSTRLLGVVGAVGVVQMGTELPTTGADISGDE